MLTKRQQVVLGKLSKTFAYVGKMSRAWLFFDTEDVPIDAAPDITSAATLYRLIDAELAALGIDSDGDAVVETTERGDELVELLTTSLTKRQQEVLKSLLRFETSGGEGYAFRSVVRKGLWNFDGAGFSRTDFCSASTIYALVDAELIGLGVGIGQVYDRTDAALTPRGRRLAELLP
jgi:hypothetical protein